MEVINIKSGQSAVIVRHLRGANDCGVVANVAQGASLTYIEVANTKTEVEFKNEFNCERDSKLTVNTIDVDNVNLVRNQIFNLNGTGVEVEVKGLYIVGSNEKCCNNLNMNHLHPNCNSKQVYKGIVDNWAKFHGHIYIAKDAQQTVALQENHNLLLNDAAKIETQPWLEIYADDVKCNHGATIGKNDDEAMFYMRQRGVSVTEAKKLLMQGYVEACVVENNEKEQIFELIEAKIQSL